MDPIEFKVVEKLVLSKGKSKNLSELIQILCKHNCRDESAGHTLSGPFQKYIER